LVVRPEREGEPGAPQQTLARLPRLAAARAAERQMAMAMFLECRESRTTARHRETVTSECRAMTHKWRISGASWRIHAPAEHLMLP
jgi:hypothetical protein